MVLDDVSRTFHRIGLFVCQRHVSKENIVDSKSEEISTAIKEASESISIQGEPFVKKENHRDSRHVFDKQNEMINKTISSQGTRFSTKPSMRRAQ